MDHKKRNKKKNKQKKAPEPLVVGGNGGIEADSSSVNLNGLTEGQDHLQSQVPEEDNVRKDVSEQNADLGQHSLQTNGTQESVTVEAEKQKWLQREATLEETIKQLQNENHSLIQKESTLEEMNKQLQNEVFSLKQKEEQLQSEVYSHKQKEEQLENEVYSHKQKEEQLQNEVYSHKQKEEQLENEVYSLKQKEEQLQSEVYSHKQKEEQLQNEVYSHKQKEATLETNIVELRAEKDSWIEKEAMLEAKLVELRAEKDSLIEKEAGLKERISKLLDGKACLGLKVESLEEKIKSLESENKSWILKENTTKETIASLNEDITRLQAQVVELEESRKNLSQEKLQLVENVSDMQSQIQNLERSIASAHASNEISEHKELKSDLEGQQALVAKLISENAELVEKVNELYAKLDQRNAKATGNYLKVETTETVVVANPISGSNNHVSVSNEELESLEVMPLKKDERFGNNDPDGQNTPTVPIFSESREIEQIPLDDNEIVVDIELQEAGKIDQNAPPPPSDPPLSLSADPLPISDAPLIGAPFRLFSFVARYVSGADLVK